MDYDILAPRLMETLARTACKRKVTPLEMLNLRLVGRLAWERKEMGGEEHVQFAYRNGTPIVPPGHSCHPVELVKRSYVDGKGWPERKAAIDRVHYFQWPDGEHWYASVAGRDITEGRQVKWDSRSAAQSAAERFIEKHGIV